MKWLGNGVRQTKNLPLFCLENHNIFIHTVITMSKLFIILNIKSLIRYMLNSNWDPSMKSLDYSNSILSLLF